ncbi:MAG TPA: ankyrin repeat domain-containing protein, partial [Planctomycetota bacterium]|nr:ankyrin repeat domain-containing protein [Planctomycetota bacterium]
MNVRVLGLVLLLARLLPGAARGGETAAEGDPMAWAPDANAALFIERIAIADYPRRLMLARARANQLIEERANLPVRGLIVRSVAFDGQADRIGVEAGDILLKLDESNLLKPEDVQTYRTQAPQTLTFFSRKNGARQMPVQAGKIGVKFDVFERDNPLLIEADRADPRWADELRAAGLVFEEDGDFAETALARALASGLPRNEQLELAAARLALGGCHFEQAINIAQRALSRGAQNAPEFYELFFQAAISDYKLDAALNCARESSNPELEKHIGELKRLVAEHEALPDELRLAPAPSARAATLFPDDLTLRAEMLAPLKSEEPEHRNDVIPLREVRESHLTELCALRPWRYSAPGARYDYFAFLPAAKNAHFSCVFTAGPSDNLHTKYERAIAFSFFDYKPDAEKSTDAQIRSSSKVAGVEFYPNRASPVTFLHSNKVFAFEGKLPPFLDDPEQEHRLDLYAMGRRIEILVDGKRVLYAPFNGGENGVGMKFWYGGAAGDLRNVAFSDLLTEDERKARVDPDVNKTYRFGWTRLHRMVQRAPPEAVAELLAHGADLKLADEEGLTALLLAVKSKRLDMVKLLLERGADVEKFDKRGRNAYALARELGFKEIADYLLKLNPNLGKGVRPPKPP